jgi:NADH-quinone oxidoreductase subunit M
MFTGPTNPKLSGLSDLGLREISIMVPLVVLIVVLGVYPKPVLDRIEPSTEIILDRIEQVTGYEPAEFGRADEVVEPEYGVIEHGGDESGSEGGD